jgi:hypothetical protein
MLTHADVDKNRQRQRQRQTETETATARPRDGERERETERGSTCDEARILSKDAWGLLRRRVGERDTETQKDRETERQREAAPAMRRACSARTPGGFYRERQRERERGSTCNEARMLGKDAWGLLRRRVADRLLEEYHDALCHCHLACVSIRQHWSAYGSIS